MDSEGLGLPTPMAPGRRKRTCYEYTLPRECVMPEFFDKFAEADLTFCLVEPSPRGMEHAGKVAGSNPVLLAKEMLFQGMYQIGDWDPQTNRDATGVDEGRSLDSWWDLIGAKGRDMINQEFVDLVQPSKEQVERFRGSRKIRQG